METTDSRIATRAHIRVVRDLMLACIRELEARANAHDASKLDSPEVEIFDEWTPRLVMSTYGAPEYAAMLAAMKPALDHHYAHNRHHPEFHKSGISDMTLIDLLEMVCDWMAAARRHSNGDVRRSISINAVRFGYGEQLASIFLRTVETIEVPHA